MTTRATFDEAKPFTLEDFERAIELIRSAPLRPYVEVLHPVEYERRKRWYEKHA